jgi:hypothetical protein
LIPCFVRTEEAGSSGNPEIRLMQRYQFQSIPAALAL